MDSSSFIWTFEGVVSIYSVKSSGSEMNSEEVEYNDALVFKDEEWKLSRRLCSFVLWLCPLTLSFDIVLWLCPMALSTGFVLRLCPKSLSYSFVLRLCPLTLFFELRIYSIWGIVCCILDSFRFHAFQISHIFLCRKYAVIEILFWTYSEINYGHCLLQMYC